MKTEALKWCVVALSFTLFGCNSKSVLKINVPNNFCGYVFVLVDEKGSRQTINIDNNGIGFLNTKCDRYGCDLEYEVFCNGKDITDECVDFESITISNTGRDFHHYASFAVKCDSLMDNSSSTRDQRWDELMKDNPKVIKWSVFPGSLADAAQKIISPNSWRKYPMYYNVPINN